MVVMENLLLLVIFHEILRLIKHYSKPKLNIYLHWKNKRKLTTSANINVRTRSPISFEISEPK
jgi:hypothetical protein